MELNQASYEVYQHKMDHTLENLQGNLNAVRAGRANPRVLDRLTVEYYGTETPIQQVANIQVPEARMITITPWDPSTLTAIEKAIQMSDIGINPANDGKMLRLNFPALTEERRRELAKQVAKYGEEAKVAIRNVRRDAMDHFKGLLKSKELSEDLLHQAEDEVQKFTDRYVHKVDEMVQSKEKDLMEI